MADAGIVAIVEPAFWLGQPRTHVGTFEDYFLSLCGWERFRASQFGIRHFCTIGLNPKEANNPDVADGVMELLPRYLEKDGVVCIPLPKELIDYSKQQKIGGIRSRRTGRIAGRDPIDDRLYGAAECGAG